MFKFIRFIKMIKKKVVWMFNTPLIGKSNPKVSPRDRKTKREDDRFITSQIFDDFWNK